MKVTSMVSLVLIAGIALLGVWMNRQLAPTHRYLPWHQTPQWTRFLTVYDKLAAKYFETKEDCQSKMLSTTFGQTQAYVCGSSENPPVLFLHGASSNALMYGQWLLPDVKQTHYSIAVDYPCDTGRSIPPNNDPTKCPSTQDEIADWVAQVLQNLEITKPVSMVGYSYGAFCSFVTALHRSHLVDKLVLLAPASVVDDLSQDFLWNALVMALFRSEWSQRRFWKWISADPNFDMLQAPPDDLEQLVTTRELAATVLSVPADNFNTTTLQQVIDHHKTFLGLGEQDVLLKNVTLAAEKGRQVGAHVHLYPNAGHVMLIEVGDAIVKDVMDFLIEKWH